MKNFWVIPLFMAIYSLFDLIVAKYCLRGVAFVGKRLKRDARVLGFVPLWLILAATLVAPVFVLLAVPGLLEPHTERSIITIVWLAIWFALSVVPTLRYLTKSKQILKEAGYIQ